jgi:NAD-dependent dihydropyrimidine dehydrogenase PreA subunit
MLIYLPDVVTLELDAAKCNGCGMCVIVCPHGVFEIREPKARIVDRDRCIECGACSMNCPAEAITVQAGVGCATGILLTQFGKTGDCCCSAEQLAPPDRPARATAKSEPGGKGCCG